MLNFEGQQKAQEFEQKAQQAAQGEQKARNFNEQNSNNQQGLAQNFFNDINQQEMANQLMSEQEKIQKQQAFSQSQNQNQNQQFNQ